ncbi:hypothetical protein [Shewanella surugensis]|uniref:Uncharacterized protein n=1 Tax=Shewanella surugensis TaxID=212020 RepID=A0ABT0LHY5_9GAMM|nr:hypothetical protein [Shewanella surugensis]MCL1127321.1 hypothetical protein [Shewanella surugensis]
MTDISTSDNTSVKLANITGATLTLSSSVSPALNSKYWEQSNTSVNSSKIPDATSVLAFSRDTGITTHDTWLFTTTCTVDGVEITLQESVKGKIWPVGSSM